MKFFERMKEKRQLPLFIALSKPMDRSDFSNLKFVPVNIYNSTKVEVKSHYKPISKIINFKNA